MATEMTPSARAGSAGVIVEAPSKHTNVSRGQLDQGTPQGGARPAAERPFLVPFFRERDSYAVTAAQEIIDRSVHATIAQLTLGLSPSALAGAYWDWAAHLAFSPGKQVQLVEKAMRKGVRIAEYIGRSTLQKGAEPCIEPLPQDKRFAAKPGSSWPFNLIYQSFLLKQQWWHNATTGVRGVTQQHENVARVRQPADPRRVLAVEFRPDQPRGAAERPFESGGRRTWCAVCRTSSRTGERRPPGSQPTGAEHFQVGRESRDTPGKVVLPQPADRAHPIRAGDRRRSAPSRC